MSEKLEHAREGMHHAHHVGDRRARRIAVLIAILAAALAIADLAEKSAQNEYLTRHVALSNDWSFFQAKNVRATVRSSEANVLASLPPSPDTEARIKAAQADAARLRDDPESGEGMKQLAERAKVQTEERDHALHSYHHYELVVSALQIAIVLASVSVVTQVAWLAVLGGGLGLLAAIYGAFLSIGVV